MADKRGHSAYLDFEGVQLRFVVTSEEAEHTAVPTEHAVESGADVSDHVRQEANRLSLQVFISNTPVKDLNGYGMQVAGIELTVPRYEKPIAPTPGALMNAAASAIGNLLSPPEPIVATVATWPNSFNAVKTEVAQLLDWKERAVVGKVITSWADYGSMVITNVSPKRTTTTGDAVEVGIELRGVRVVEVGSATLPIPTEPRGKVSINKGRQAPTELPNGPKKSTLQAGTDLIRGRR